MHAGLLRFCNGFRIEAELAMYNAMDTLEVSSPSDVPADQQANVLLYWNDAQKKLPTLSVVARKYLGITATSVASERVFSKTGYSQRSACFAQVKQSTGTDFS